MSDATTPARSVSARYWDAAAKQNAAWYVANAYTEMSPAFFDQGARETDEFLRFCGVTVDASDTVLEIGSGVGRMTRRLADLASRVIATDVSAAMLEHARANLAGSANVEYLVVRGDGRLPVASESVDVVFSYIVLQHVPELTDHLRYLTESIRVLRPGGRLAVQVRAPGVAARAHEWAGYLVHLTKGRNTLHPAWRGCHPSSAELLATAGPGVRMHMRRYNTRHSWVIATKSR